MSFEKEGAEAASTVFFLACVRTSVGWKVVRLFACQPGACPLGGSVEVPSPSEILFVLFHNVWYTRMFLMFLFGVFFLGGG